MRVFFDYQAFSLQAYGGVSRYVAELAAAISNINGVEARILAFAHINQHLEAVKGHKGLVVGRRIASLRGTWRLRSALNRTLTRMFLGRNHPDLVHETYYCRQSAVPTDIPTVVTVHDMIHEKYPHYFSSRDFTVREKADSVHRARGVICISEATRRDVVERFALDPGKVFVVHHGFSLRTDASNATERQVESPYLLFVGHRAGYKNFDNVLRAYAQSERLQKHCALICFGGGDFSASERELINGLLRGRAHQVHHVIGDDNVLANLYRNAEALVYSSRDEGFGIPLLEAMSQGCPVVCSDTDVFREVAGDAAEYVDPETAESILSGIEHVLNDVSRRISLRELGHRRSALFSWERCAAETVKVYERVIEA